MEEINAETAPTMPLETSPLIGTSPRVRPIEIARVASSATAPNVQVATFRKKYSQG